MAETTNSDLMKELLKVLLGDGPKTHMEYADHHHQHAVGTLND